jgi:hypothetical protein
MCTWTNDSLPFPQTNSICGLVLAGYLPSSIERPLIWRNQTDPLRRGRDLIPANPNLAGMS